MANLRSDVMDRFISIFESEGESAISLLSVNGWGDPTIEVNKNAELYAYPAPSSPAAQFIHRIFLTPKSSMVLRIRIVVVDEKLINRIGKCLSTVPKLESKGRGLDELNKPHVEYEAMRPKNFWSSTTAEANLISVIEPVITAMAKEFGFPNT